MTSLRDLVHSTPECATALAEKDCDTLVELMNNLHPRTKPSTVSIGNGTVLDVLGFAAGTTFLASIFDNQQYRFVVPLLEQGRLEIFNQTAQQAIQSFVPSLLTQEQANKLLALGFVTYPYDVVEMHEALFYPDGTEK